ncbi:hypothetical protein FRC03_005862 [Tulasnella sp. 419]|nr:hypothetical protein FRC02_006836 [Tulasnella sp. 418]KAG8961012.1 hypothetical protein FRC03_005862 [Tulasnella sp. 419]
MHSLLLLTSLMALAFTDGASALAISSPLSPITKTPITREPTRTITSTPTFTKCVPPPQPIPGDYAPIFASTPGTAVSYLQLDELPSGLAGLTPDGIQLRFEYETSAAGGYLRVNPITRCPTTKYLTVIEAGPHSYKPLAWTTTLQTSYWVVEPAKNVTTSRTSPYGVVDKFIACGPTNELFLQTGNELPENVKCTETTLELGMIR